MQMNNNTSNIHVYLEKCCEISSTNGKFKKTAISGLLWKQIYQVIICCLYSNRDKLSPAASFHAELHVFPLSTVIVISLITLYMWKILM